MSRGPGRWQRVILAAVREHGAVWVRTLLPGAARKAEVNAATRAAYRLAATGGIELTRYMCGSAKLLAVRPGHVVTKRPDGDGSYVWDGFQVRTRPTLRKETALADVIVRAETSMPNDDGATR